MLAEKRHIWDAKQVLAALKTNGATDFKLHQIRAIMHNDFKMRYRCVK